MLDKRRRSTRTGQNAAWHVNASIDWLALLAALNCRLPLGLAGKSGESGTATLRGHNARHSVAERHASAALNGDAGGRAHHQLASSLRIPFNEYDASSLGTSASSRSSTSLCNVLRSVPSTFGGATIINLWNRFA